MKKKSLIIALLLLVVGFFSLSIYQKTAFADDKQEGVNVQEVTKDVDTLYKNYQNNSFDLMTKEKTGFNGLKKAISNFSGTIKTFTWEFTKGLGQFNAEMVKMLFSLDIIEPIRGPMQNLTAVIATNMLSVAGTVGISFVALIMGIKFIGEQRFKQFIRVFVMTILIFVGLSILKNASANDSLFTTLFNIDKQVETQFVNVNPVIGDSSIPVKEQKGGELEDSKSRLTSAGDLIASRVFFTNVYEPYLLVNYGTTNLDSIRKKKVEYDGNEYDRINILLDNDISDETGEKIHEEVTNYETDELKNKTVQHYNNLKNTFFLGFYFVVNLIQTAAFFILCFIRIVISVMQVFLLPVLPLLLFAGLFLTEMNVFINYGKGFGMTIFIKSMTSFACILFATFLSFGFQMSNSVDNPWRKILTIVIYLLAPLGIYFFRYFLAGLFTGQVTAGSAIAFATHPFSTNKLMRDNYKRKRKEARDYQKAQKEKQRDINRQKRELKRRRGEQDIGLKQPDIKRKENRSNLRKEMQQKPQHKSANNREKLQQKLEGLHKQSQEAENQELANKIRQRKRKPMDAAAQKIGSELRTANENLRAQAEQSESRTELKGRRRRSGSSSKRYAASNTYENSSTPSNKPRRQGQKINYEERQQQLEHGRKTNPKSVARKVGQRQASTSVTPKANSSSRLRTQSGNSSSARRAPSVRKKMNAVQQVIKNNPAQVVQTEVIEEVPNTPNVLTRVERRTSARAPLKRQATSRTHDGSPQVIRREVKRKKVKSRPVQQGKQK